MNANDLEQRDFTDDPAYWVTVLEEALLSNNTQGANKARDELSRLGWRAEPIEESTDAPPP
jgi:hypothetical protein